MFCPINLWLVPKRLHMYSCERAKCTVEVPSNPLREVKRCTSTAAIFTQVKYVGEAGWQKAG